jgi:acetyl-CoA synthetase
MLKPGYAPSEELKRALDGSPRSHFKIVVDDADFVDVLPKTTSGKIMRCLIKSVISGLPFGDYSTIEDEGSIQERRNVNDTLMAGLKKRP